MNTPRLEELPPEIAQRLHGPVKRRIHARAILEALPVEGGMDAFGLARYLQSRGIAADRADIYNAMTLLVKSGAAERLPGPTTRWVYARRFARDDDES